MAHPRHEGAAPHAWGHGGGRTGTGAVGNPACGDVLRLHIHVVDGRVEGARFESLGSPYQRATADVLCECVTGQRVEDARRQGPGCVLDRLPDLPARSQYLARLAVEALGMALEAASRPDRHASGPVQKDLLDEAGASKFLRHVLAAGEQTTAQVDAAAAQAGVLLPGSTAKCLARASAAGEVEGRMAPDHSAWLWRLTPQVAGNSPAPGSPGATP